MAEKKATFKIIDPMYYGLEKPKYVEVACEVNDEEYVVCKIGDVSISIHPIKVIIEREPPTPHEKFSISGGIGFPTVAQLEKVRVEWFR